jgi:N-acetylglucosamine-6-phosphate deacetylase
MTTSGTPVRRPGESEASMRAHDGEPRSGDGRVLLAGARVVTPAGTLRSGWVAVEGGVITAVGPGLPVLDRAVGPGLPAVGRAAARDRLAGGAPVQDLGGAWLVPGFVDIHVHGGGGAWLSSTDPEEVGQAVRFHLGHGTTSMLASIATSPIDGMVASAAAVAVAAAGALAPVLAGIHLEGPFISRERSGAQDPEAIRDPDPDEMERLLEACGGWARVVTVAPERPGGLDLVRLITGSGVVPAVGHTQAGYEEASAAVDAGASVSTHLFNAMPSLHHRDLGTVGAALSRDEVVCELVNDGVHLRPEVVWLVFQAVGARRVALVTDAIAAAGMADGDYSFGRVPLRVRGGVARLVDGRTIAGSTLTMDAALRRAVQEVGIPMEDAVTAAASTPARAIGIGERTGSIEPGKAANLVVLDDDLEVVAVMAAGRWVPRQAPAERARGAARTT